MTEITDEKIQAVVEAVGKLQEELRPHLKSLSMRERRSLPKMGDASIAFVEKAHEYGQAYKELVPPFLDLGRMTQNLKLYSQLDTLAKALNPLTASVNDTMLETGSDAYTSALSIYRNAKNAKKMNVQNARVIHDHLAQRFASIRRKAKTPESAEPIAAE